MDIDPTKPGKYPVVLSDALLGKDTAAANHVYTGVRYNTRVRQEVATTAKLKPDAQNPGAGITYDLSFLDNAGRYSYQGTRRVGDAQYVLIFDAQHEHFVLHQLDSTFDLNLTRTPENDSAEALRHKHGHLGRVRNNARAYVPPKPTKPRPAAAAAATTNKPVAASAPPAKPSPAARNKAAQDSDDDEDDDFGLTIENPDGARAQKSQPMRDFSPAFNSRRFSEFVEQQQQDDDEDALGEPDDDLQVEDPDADADAEEDDDDSDDASVDHFKLPSPLARQMEVTTASSIPATNGHVAAEEEEEEQVSEEDEDDVPMQDVAPPQAADEDDEAGSDDGLEAELMAALGEQESDVSEEE